MKRYDHTPAPMHSNAFVMVNNIPYVLAEYLDQRNLQQVDRSCIRNEVLVDNESEAMRTTIEITVDDIGHRASDGKLAVLGNVTMQKRLLKAIEEFRHYTQNQLDIIRKNLVLRVSYQVENARTGSVIRTNTEDFRIDRRAYYIDINAKDITDNAIITNFCDTKVSTINEFTHGRDRMIFRVNSVQMFYECLRQDKKPQKNTITSAVVPQLPTMYGMSEDNYWAYHMANRHTINMGIPGQPGDDFGSYGHDDCGMISPPAWTIFNRFYHFENNGRDLVLHRQEILDPQAETFLVPGNIIRVNQTFVINPGQRIVFRFCIWKNDAVIVNDTTSIVQALGAPYISGMVPRPCPCHPPEETTPSTPSEPSYGDDEDDEKDNCGCQKPTHGHRPPPPPPGEIQADWDNIMWMLNKNTQDISKQNCVINSLSNSVRDLANAVKAMQGKLPEEEHIHVDKNEDGKCDTCDEYIIPEPGPTDKALMNGVYYDSLAAALSAAGTPSKPVTIKMVKDELDGTGTYILIPSNVTLDMGGHIVSGDYDHTVFLLDNVENVTIKNGTILSRPSDTKKKGNGIMIQHSTGVTLEDLKVDVTGTFGVLLGGGAQGYYAHAVIDGCEITQHGRLGGAVSVYGPDRTETSGEKSILRVSGKSVLLGTGYGIMGNGSFHNTEIILDAGVSVTAGNGVEYGCGIYHPQKGKLVTSADVTSPETAIEIRSGILEIRGGTLISTAKEFSCNKNGSGTTTVGAALAIAQHTTKKDINVKIAGGSFKAIRALNECNPQENDPAPNVTMEITGGTFDGEVAMEDVQKVIIGGSFTSDVSKYVADGYVQIASGKVVPQ